MKTVLPSLSDIPEPLREHYEERDGRYVLKIEDEPPGFVRQDELAEANQKLTEFRDNNRGLKSKLDEFERKYGDVDIEEHKRLKERIAELERHGIKPGDDFEGKMKKRIEELVTPLQKQVEELTEREKAAKAELAQKQLEGILTQEGVNAGIAEKAIPDFLRRAHEVWRFEDGAPVARKGEEPLYSEKKPSEPLSPREWIMGLAKDAPHLFRSSSGGGSKGGAGGGADNGKATYDGNDPKDFLQNLDKIAAGDMVRRET